MKTNTVERTYKVHYVDHTGVAYKENVKAASRIGAQMKIAPGFTVEQVIEQKPWYEFSIGRTVPAEQLLLISRQLAAFTSAGVPIMESLEILAQSTNNKALRKALNEMIQDVRDGESFSDAAKRQRDVFPHYYLSMLEAADRIGDLSATLETLAAYIERDLVARKAVKAALYYPAILMVLSVFAVVVLSTTVLPKFQTFFTALNAKLPPATVALLAMASFFSQFWWLMLGLGISAVIAFFALRKLASFKFVTDQMLLRVPIISPLLRIVTLERFTRIMSSLVQAGVSLPDSLAIASRLMSNSVYQRAIREVRAGVVAGSGLSEPLKQTGVFPPEIIQIVRVGEQTGRLSEQLAQAGLYYSKEVDYRLKTITALIEPIVLLIVGGLVAFVAIALVSAMYGIYSSSGLG